MSERYRLVKIKGSDRKKRVSFLGLDLKRFRFWKTGREHDLADRVDRIADADTHHHDDLDVWILTKQRPRRRTHFYVSMFMSAFLLLGLVVAWMMTGEALSLAGFDRVLSLGAGLPGENLGLSI